MCSSFVEPYGWAFLPDLLLEEIFSQLPIKNLGRCSQVCLNWYRISQQGYAWRRFQYKDKMFTRRKYTSHAGWQYMIDHWKLRFLIVKATSKWRVLEIEPVTILFNLYEFIRVLTNFSEYYERNSSEKPLQGIRSFSFKWQLHVHVRGENETERILYKFDSQLISLCIINLTKVYRPFLQLGLFLFLEHLTVSPQHLDESIVILLADLRHLKSLIILQNDKTFGAKAVDSKAWLSFAERNNHTRVYLIQAGTFFLFPAMSDHLKLRKRQNALLIQPKAPVYAIIFDKSTGQLTGELTQEICHNYSTTLQFFLQKGLERRYRSREFSKRVDIFAIELAHRCPNLKLLAIRERMCFASALLLAQIARSHRMTICLRRNALLKRVNWSDDAVRSILGSESNQKWIRGHCRNFETLEKTIRNIMGTTAPIAMNQISSEKVMEKLKRTEVMHKAEKSLKMAEKVEHVPNNLKTHNSKERRGRSYQIIGDLDTTDSSFEYSLDNTLAMESLEMIKGKHGLVLEGEEIDHQMVKVPQRSDSSDYSLFDSQSSRRDIREQRFRLFKLNTSVARRVAAVLEDSIISTSTQDKKEKPATEADTQQIPEVEETQNNLIAHT
ncbi:unnamed protein product [Acanthocheilonema viteae]|uniref:F-box domain-containing protein n=1 Tax=Acanthocheilonema viteae TaxID=6277 RepID=A0A498SLW2_ACAVI|nr:unnamed protein product [Acanthocheilonema viteae]